MINLTNGNLDYNFISANGMEYIDDTGKKHYDFYELSMCLGHNNQNFNNKIIEALSGAGNSKLKESKHLNTLYQYFDKTTNGDFKYVHLTASGSETTEWAVKLSQKYTGKSEVVTFWGSIHGRTHFSASMSGTPVRKTHYAPLSSGIVYAVYPTCKKCKFKLNNQTCNYYCIDFLEEKIKYESTQNIAAVIIEPYQTSVVSPPTGYLKKLREWTKSRGILLIFDEIQTGMGRCGEIYCYKREDVIPDMLLLGKALGNGMHISALLHNCEMEEKYIKALKGGAGNEITAVAAACSVFEELLENGLLENINNCSEEFLVLLSDLNLKFEDYIFDIRIRGLSIAIEFKDEIKFEKFFLELTNSGFLVGKQNNTLIIKPSYCINKKQIREFIAKLEDILTNMENGLV